MFIYFAGDSYKSLSYSFRVAPNTISGLIPETCEAIYECLKEEYFTVSVQHVFCVLHMLLG